MAAQVSGDKHGTPTSLLVSIVSTIVIFALAEIQNSFLVSEAFSMRYVLMSYIGLGLTLAFFWKRLETSPFLKMSAALYLFGLWVSLFITTLAPVLLASEYPLMQATFLQQFGLVFVALSGVSLIIALLQKQKMNPGLVLSVIGAVGLVLTSGGSIFFKSQHRDDDLISSASHSGKKEAAVSDQGHDDEGEEISAHSVGRKLAGNDEKAGKEAGHGSHTQAEHGDAHADANHDEQAAPAHGVKGHDEAVKPTHGRNEERLPHGKAVGKNEQNKKLLKLAAKALSDDHEQDERHEPAPSKVGHSSDDKDEAAPRNVAPSKPSAKKHKTASLDHAFASSEKAHERSKAEPAPLWAYEAGEISPEHWGEIADDFRTCAVGQQQSPIDIPSSWPLLDDISLDYKLTTVSVVDNGHAIVFNVGDQNYATIAGKRYKLLQFHVHTPSEHWIDGRLSPLEIHFVHKDERNRLAVIGVMVEAGAEQKVMGELLGYVPQGINLPSSPRGKVFNIASIIPSKLKVYRYRGSLTTPPCSENVLWSLASEKISLSTAQIESFKTRYKNNARPVQKRSAPVK